MYVILAQSGVMGNDCADKTSVETKQGRHTCSIVVTLR